MKIAAETTERKLKYPTRAAAVAIAGMSVLALSGCDDDGQSVERPPMVTGGVVAPRPGGSSNGPEENTPPDKQKAAEEESQRRIKTEEETLKGNIREGGRLGGDPCPSAYEKDEESEKED